MMNVIDFRFVMSCFILVCAKMRRMKKSVILDHMLDKVRQKAVKLSVKETAHKT